MAGLSRDFSCEQLAPSRNTGVYQWRGLERVGQANEAPGRHRQWPPSQLCHCPGNHARVVSSFQDSPTLHKEDQGQWQICCKTQPWTSPEYCKRQSGLWRPNISAERSYLRRKPLTSINTRCGHFPSHTHTFLSFTTVVGTYSYCSDLCIDLSGQLLLQSGTCMFYTEE